MVPALIVLLISFSGFVPVFVHDVVAGDALVEFLGLLRIDLLDEFGGYSAP